jgi:flavin reductase (DIM6/NTAB) family NADH-FMN oxidoreductase RutF
MENIAEPDSHVKAMDPHVREIQTTLRKFSYGLYAVTVRSLGETSCMTANWVSQCSASPPMVAIAMENDSHTLAMVRAGGRFCLSPFEVSQRRLAARISKPWARTPHKLTGVEMIETAGGTPVPAGSLAWLACEVRSEAVTGDHVLLTAEITQAGGLLEGDVLTLLESGFRYG